MWLVTYTSRRLQPAAFNLCVRTHVAVDLVRYFLFFEKRSGTLLHVLALLNCRPAEFGCLCQCQTPMETERSGGRWLSCQQWLGIGFRWSTPCMLLLELFFLEQLLLDLDGLQSSYACMSPAVSVKLRFGLFPRLG